MTAAEEAARELRRAAHDVHDPHESLPGFDAQQIWHDGCRVCEARGALVMLEKLDRGSFRWAWYRAGLFQLGQAEHVARAEVKLLDLLGVLQNQGCVLPVVVAG